MMVPTLFTSCHALPPGGAAESGGGPATRRRIFTLGGLALLAGCGFQLRQAPDFVFDTLVLNAAPASSLGNELRRNLAASGKVEVQTAVTPALPAAPPSVVAPSPAVVASAALARRAAVVLDILQEQREKVVVGLNASGQVREFQLRTRLRFRLRTPAGKELVSDTELLQTRDISFNEGAVLAKEAEEALLFRDMQTDLVQQLMRRLAALRTL